MNMNQSPLIAAIGCSLLAGPFAPALHTQPQLSVSTPRALGQSPTAATVLRKRAIYDDKSSHHTRRRLLSMGHRKGREDAPSGPEPSQRNGGGREDEEIYDEEEDEPEYLNASDFIDFSQIQMDRKLFDDVQDYGPIRSLESPHETNPIEPLSASDIEMWTKIKKQNNKQARWRQLSKLSPLTSLLLPLRQLPSSEKSRALSTRETRRQHSHFGNGQLSPRLLRGFLSKPNSARNALVALSTLAFAYQIVVAVWYLPRFNRLLTDSVARNAHSAALAPDVPRWSRKDVILRALGGTAVVIASGSGVGRATGGALGRGIVAHSMGPFFLDWAHQPFPLSHYQRHRYLSSGFLHGSLLHLGMNVRALLSLPSWLENGIGKGLYLTCYLLSIMTGNMAHSLSTMGSRRLAASSFCIGASGGICGLYGLLLASLQKMGNDDAVYYVWKSMLWLLAFGLMIPNVSTAGHVGGFLGGWLIGFLFGPGYDRSYALNRADGIYRDTADAEFRSMMGPGIYPSAKGAILPLKYLWVGIACAAFLMPGLRTVPIALLRSLIQPGSLSGVRAMLR